MGDVTDTLGRYRLGPLAPGEYYIVFQHIGYRKELAGPVSVLPHRKAVLDLQLVLEVLDMEAVLVTPRTERFEPEGITARLTARMIQESPGAAQDVFLVLQTLPGVSSGGDDSKLYVRGGRPEENLILYDGATIRNPFHFDFIGGGFFTIFNSSLVSDVKFYSGGFPARYGDRLSAVMVIENREGSRERKGAEFSLSMADAKVLLESPVTKRAATILTFRRSYFDLLMNRSGFAADYDLLPVFFDLNSKTDVFLTDRHHVSVNLLYSREKMSGYFDEPHLEGTHTWSSESWTAALRLRSIFTPGLMSDVNVYWSEGYHDGSHADGAGTENTRQGEIAVKADFGLQMESHTVHAGAWLVQDRGDMRVRLPLHLAYNFEELYFASSGNAMKISAYVEDTWEANRRISLNYGVRGDHVVISSETAVSPRLNLVVTPAKNLQLSVSYGVYTQSPPGYELADNPSQRSRESRAWGFGVNGTTVSDIFWSLEAYQKTFSRLMTVDETGHFAHDGYGDVSGYELYVRKRAGEKFVGWFSLTRSVARRKEGTARSLSLFDYDQTYLVSAVAQYRVTEKWTLSSRFRYATGKPYTPAEGGWFDPGTSRYFPILGETNSSRFPPYHRLDVRVARQFPDVLGGVTIYFETINTYDRDNVVYYVWSEDFSTRRNFTVFPFLPIVGVDVRL